MENEMIDGWTKTCTIHYCSASSLESGHTILIYITDMAPCT